ncbi:membrane dipeptidase [Streptomyces sp. NBC_01508]|uniref:membrane dipeptidase n=1 Tax=Streptomyces sp. NBC_01508 TaxID=2903888 RepID=UPI00386D03FB
MADLRDDPIDSDTTAAAGDLDAQPSQPSQPPQPHVPTETTPAPSAERARVLLSSHPVVDGHNSLAPTLLRRRGAGHSHDLEQGESSLDTDLPRLRAGALGAQFWSLQVDSLQVADDAADTDGAVSTTLELIDLVRDLIASCPDTLRLALGAGDLADARNYGRVASLLGPVSGRAMGDSLATLRAFHFLGVRVLALAGARWADDGLTRFGQEAVREMNRLGVVVDLTGACDETARATFAVTKAPAMFSHGDGDVTDEILTLLRANSGVCMVSFAPGPTASDARATAPDARATARDARAPSVSAVADRVERVRDVAGPQCVGLSGTYGREAEAPRTLGLEDPSCYPHLITELLDRGWDDTEITDLTWGNAARVLRDTEFLARAAQGRRPASMATIEELDAPRR